MLAFHPRDEHSGHGFPSPCSRRAQDVLKLLAEGFRYKEIAAELGISLDTVREYARRIYAKLHVSSRTEAVVKYLGGRTTPPPIPNQPLSRRRPKRAKAEL